MNLKHSFHDDLITTDFNQFLSSNYNIVWSFFRTILIFSVSLSDWGHPDLGCKDNSDKIKPFKSFESFDTVSGCGGKNYSYPGSSRSKNVTWQWFACHQTKRCITIENRCDGLPNPACVYQDGNGHYIAEDEEFCQG